MQTLLKQSKQNKQTKQTKPNQTKQTIKQTNKRQLINHDRFIIYLIVIH